MAKSEVVVGERVTMKSSGDFPAQAVVNEQLFHDYREPSGSLVEPLDDANKSICAVEFGTKPLRL